MDFYSTLTYDDLYALGAVLNQQSAQPEDIFTPLVDKVITEFPDVKEAMLEFFGCYTMWVDHETAERLMQPLFSLLYQDMTEILLMEPESWKQTLATWRLRIKK